MGLGMPAAAPTALELQRAAFSAPGQDVTAGAAPTAVGAPAERPPGLPAGADLEQAEEGQLLDEALEAAFWEALPRQPGGETAGASGGAGADAGAAPAVREKPSAGAGGASGEPAEAAVAASAAGNVSLLAGLVQPAVGRTGRQGEAGACLGGRLPSVERVLAEQEVQVSGGGGEVGRHAELMAPRAAAKCVQMPGRVHASQVSAAAGTLKAVCDRLSVPAFPLFCAGDARQASRCCQAGAAGSGF